MATVVDLSKGNTYLAIWRMSGAPHVFDGKRAPVMRGAPCMVDRLT